MMYSNRSIEKLLCACLLLASLLSMVSVAGHLGHECVGEHCTLCAQATHARYIVLLLGLVALRAILAFVTQAMAVHGSTLWHSTGLATLVEMKIRLNN